VPTFIGIDLAWQSERNHTGAVALTGNRERAELVAVSDSIRSIDEVRAFLNDHDTDEMIIAIDAPLIIENPTGQRPCETAMGRAYGRREASCHTSNRRLYPSAASVELAKELIAANYIHAPTAGTDADKILLEVYPHAGLVALFDLAKSLKYKKGSTAQKRLGLGILTN
jgi:predicted RNase H-like nuclease